MSGLGLIGVSLAFGGVKALDSVDLAMKPAEIVGIIGPNGAGKTTLLNVICGIHRPDAGEIHLDGHRIDGRKPSDIARLGLRRTFQTSQLFPGMTVLENVMTGLHVGTRTGLLGAALSRRSARREDGDAAERALRMLSFVGMGRLAERGGRELSFGQQRLVEVARALVGEPTALLLDEPAVGLSLTRVAEFDRLLRRIRDERGITLVVVEHVIRLVMEISDRIVVLNYGRKIAEGAAEAVRRDPAVVEAYLGKELDARGAAS